MRDKAGSLVGPAFVVLGTLAMVVGGGVAVPWLVDTGRSATSLAALAALGAGLTLVAVGWVRIGRGLRRWWRLLLVPMVLVWLQLLVVPLVPAVVGTSPPPGALTRAAPPGAEEVVVAGPSGVRLAAWFLPGSNGAAVVALPGSGSSRTAVLDHGLAVAARGYSVLLPDPRGHGASPGPAMDFGWWGEPDVAAAVAWVAVRPEVRTGRVGLLGLSMGGEQAVRALAATDPRIGAVVAEGVEDQAVDRLAAGGQGLVADLVDRISVVATDVCTAASPPPTLRDAVAASGVPVLLVAGAGEGATAAALAAARPGTVTVWDLPTVGHTAALDERPAEWRATVLGFLDGALLGG